MVFKQNLNKLIYSFILISKFSESLKNKSNGKFGLQTKKHNYGHVK